MFKEPTKMYTETGSSLIFPNFSPGFYDDVFSYSHKSNASLDSLVQSCNISDYDHGGEGDLFKAPEPIIEQPVITVDPMTLIICGEDDLTPQELNDEFLTNVFHEYQEILEKDAETETSPLSEVLNYKFAVKTDESSIVKEHVHPPGQIPKSMSSDCLNAMDRVHEAPIKPGFLEVDFENAYGMRRAIKTLVYRATTTISDHIVEDRWQKLSRYRIKKREILVEKLSMHAGKHWQTVSQGSGEGLPRQRNVRYGESNLKIHRKCLHQYEICLVKVKVKAAFPK